MMETNSTLLPLGGENLFQLSVNMCGVLSAIRITEPIFSQTMNSHRCVTHVLLPNGNNVPNQDDSNTFFEAIHCK
jgi:hypothetical protein